MEIVNQVRATKDYALFSQIEGNRIVDELHVERLKASFEKSYLMSPIIVNQKYEIIDGQHRFNAAKALGYPVNFIMVNGYTLHEVQLLNTNLKNWKKEDYLHAYCDLGYEEYMLMQQFMNDYPDFGFAGAEKILTNTTNGANIKRYDPDSIFPQNYRQRSFQEGDLKILNLELSYENADKIMSFKPYYDGFNRSFFIAAMIGIFKNKNYNHQQMIQKLKINPGAMVHCSNVSQYKELIENIFNYRSREKVSLRF